MPRVSVLMPTFRQMAWVRRAVDSLLSQSLGDWELHIIDDGSPDGTADQLAPYLADMRITLHRLPRNGGLGAALNVGLDASTAPLVTYLPSDDVLYPEHLASLVDCLDSAPDLVLAYSGLRHHYNRFSTGAIEGYPLQLVQVMHRRAPDRWMERGELVTDDLERMYWSKLRARGPFASTGRVTAEWVSHPRQRHKILREPEGGINTARAYYSIQEPMRFHSTAGHLIDEIAYYRRFRERPDTPPAADGLTIVLVGELAYNAERILALEERGHRLYGLWMPDPYWYNTVGPLPFGHVTDLPPAGWREALRALQPDLIYGLLNWQAVPFCNAVLEAVPEIPFVWHFKEGPFISLEKGHWPQLIDLYTRSAGQIYTSPEMRDWFDTVVPGLATNGRSLVLDGDLPKAEWFDADPSPRRDREPGALHTVVPGRPIGLTPERMAEMAAHNIHLHFYGDFTHGQWDAWIKRVRTLAPHHLHLHANVDQRSWVREFSQYDAGWLHLFHSTNGGEIRRADWDDLNYPARMATLAAAGLPMLQADNTRSIVATQSLIRDLDMGLFFHDIPELSEQMGDERRMEEIRDHVWRGRDRFTFDYHADRLVDFFRAVVSR